MIRDFLTAFFSWLRSVFSEPDGTGSSTRVVISALIGFAIAAGFSFAYLVHIKTITIEQFDGFLTAAGTFITVTCGPLYGVNKLADYGKNKQPTQGQQ
jgi:hypothetical protein